jgi:hypothetical protein
MVSTLWRLSCTELPLVVAHPDNNKAITIQQTPVLKNLIIIHPETLHIETGNDSGSGIIAITYR